MKIELQKFQKLIENRIQRKNALLNCDIKRMYPMCNHGLLKPLTDEFRPEYDQLKGYKMTSPKEQMMNKQAHPRPNLIDSAKMQVLPSTLWRRHYMDEANKPSNLK
jgi:hypothetical protein